MICRTLRVTSKLLCILLAATATAATPARTDVLVYGGTASGIIAAYSASREGRHVILLEPGDHLGGMVTGGLSATDLGHFQIIGGYARDFYRRVAQHYGIHDLGDAANWRSEPHVDSQVFQAMLSETHIEIHLHERLLEHNGVRTNNRRVESITTEDHKQWRAKIFIDCSYEGDLMAQAKVTYTVGRESTAQYSESLAGVRDQTPKHQFTWPVSAYDDGHYLLPEVSPGPLAAPGSADKLEQAYNFRFILTHDPANRLPYPKPDHYNTAQYALLARYLAGFQPHLHRDPNFHDVTNPVDIPNSKADYNNNGPVSTDYIGHSATYPDGSYAERRRLWQNTLDYVEGFFYFLSADPSVPASLQHEVNEWGLPEDEFQNTSHLPNQLYIREGRRMVGVYVMRQADLQTDRTKPDSIGMGSYQSDSHNVERIATGEGFAFNEGDVQVPVEPYEIPYRVIMPEKSQIQNLIVPVCFSATHVAYSSLRMEPQYMIMGQAAGVAASLAIAGNIPVQDVPVPALQASLKSHGAILTLSQAIAK